MRQALINYELLLGISDLKLNALSKGYEAIDRKSYKFSEVELGPGGHDVLAEVLPEAVSGGRTFGQDCLDLIDEAVLDDVTGSKFVERVGEDVGVLVLGAPRV